MKRGVRPSTQLVQHFGYLASRVMEWSETLPQPVALGVTGLGPGVGTSMVAFNLAAALANQVRRKTLLVEANFGNPFLTRADQRTSGLSEILAGEATAAECQSPTTVPNLCVIGPGRATATEGYSLDLELMRPLISENLGDCQFTVFDLAPVRQPSVAWSLMGFLSGTILVLEEEQMGTTACRDFHALARRRGIELVGSVANRVVPEHPDGH